MYVPVQTIVHDVYVCIHYIQIHVSVLSQGGKVSPMVRYNVLNVLYAYAYTVRLYSGEHHDLAVEAAQVSIFERTHHYMCNVHYICTCIYMYMYLFVSTLAMCSLLQTVLDISSCLSDNASFSLAGDALTHAVTTVQQVQCTLYVGLYIHAHTCQFWYIVEGINYVHACIGSYD